MAHVCILFRTLIPCLEAGYKCLPQDNGGMTWNRHAISVGVQSRKQKPLQPERLKTENYVLTKVSGGLKESAGGWALRITPKDKKLAHQGRTQECGASGVSPPERSSSNPLPGARLQATHGPSLCEFTYMKVGEAQIDVGASRDGRAWGGVTVRTHRTVCEPCRYRPSRQGLSERRGHKQPWSATKCDFKWGSRAFLSANTEPSEDR